MTHVDRLTVEVLEAAYYTARSTAHAVTLMDDTAHVVVAVDQKGRVAVASREDLHRVAP